MRKYDLTLVLRPSLKEADRKKLIDTIKKQLEGLKIVKEDEWGQKPLSYTIKKELAGYYIQLKLETENTIPAGFEQKLINNESVLRHLLLRTK